MLVAAVMLAAALAPAARADGGPLFSDSGGWRGILAPTGYRYVTIDERNVNLLVRIAPDLHVATERPLPGRYTIPAVAIDRTTAGLTADGKMLVLMEPRLRFGRKHTRFLLMSLPGMHVRAAVTLDGDFTFDAMAPDGSVLYFIQYLSKSDPTRYQVRAFDTTAGKLVRQPIVDRSEPDEQMRGYPVSRAMSADGRFAYTLYDGGGDTPFVHVLDTERGEAHCVDLDALAGRQDIYGFRLRRGAAGSIDVELRGRPVLTLDASTFAVRTATEAAPSGGARETWVATAAGAAALLLLLGVMTFVLRRRRRPATA